MCFECVPLKYRVEQLEEATKLDRNQTTKILQELAEIKVKLNLLFDDRIKKKNT